MEFEFWKMAYDAGWIPIEMVKEACDYKLITEEEYKLITGCIYPSLEKLKEQEAPKEVVG